MATFNDDLLKELGLTREQWEAYKAGIASIETGKLKNPYSVIGGSGKRYNGKYQMGEAAISDAARILGKPPPTREEFLKNPDLQEELYLAFTVANHRYLQKKSPKYASMSPQQRISVLPRAQLGMGSLRKELETGVVTKDAWGTPSTKFEERVNERLGSITPGITPNITSNITSTSESGVKSVPTVTPFELIRNTSSDQDNQYTNQTTSNTMATPSKTQNQSTPPEKMTSYRLSDLLKSQMGSRFRGMESVTSKDIEKLGRQAGYDGSRLKKLVKGFEQSKGKDLIFNEDGSTFRTEDIGSGDIAGKSSRQSGNRKGFDAGDLIGLGRNVNILGGLGSDLINKFEQKRQDEFKNRPSGPADPANIDVTFPSDGMVIPEFKPDDGNLNDLREQARKGASDAVSEFMAQDREIADNLTKDERFRIDFEKAKRDFDARRAERDEMDDLEKWLQERIYKEDMAPIEQILGGWNAKRGLANRIFGTSERYQKALDLHKQIRNNPDLANKFTKRVPKKEGFGWEDAPYEFPGYDDREAYYQWLQSNADQDRIIGENTGFELLNFGGGALLKSYLNRNAPKIMDMGMSKARSIFDKAMQTEGAKQGVRALQEGSKKAQNLLGIGNTDKALNAGKVTSQQLLNAGKEGAPKMLGQGSQKVVEKGAQYPIGTIGGEGGITKVFNKGSEIYGKYAKEFEQALKNNPLMKRLQFKDGTRVKKVGDNWVTYRKGGVLPGNDVPKGIFGLKTRTPEERRLAKQARVDRRSKGSNAERNAGGAGDPDKVKAKDLLFGAGMTALPHLVEAYARKKELTPPQIPFRKTELAKPQPQDLARDYKPMLNQPSYAGADFMSNRALNKYTDAYNRDKEFQFNLANQAQKRDTYMQGIGIENQGRMSDAQRQTSSDMFNAQMKAGMAGLRYQSLTDPFVSMKEEMAAKKASDASLAAYKDVNKMKLAAQNPDAFGGIDSDEYREIMGLAPKNKKGGKFKIKRK